MLLSLALSTLGTLGGCSAIGQTRIDRPTAGSGISLAAASGRWVVSPPYASTVGGNSLDAPGKSIDLHTDPANTCKFGNPTTVCFEDGYSCVDGADFTWHSDTWITVKNLPAHAEGVANIYLSNMEGGGCESGQKATIPNAFEFVQYGATIDGGTNSMALFRTMTNPSTTNPPATDERHAIDGSLFPNVTLGAVSDVDVVAQAGAALKRLLLVEKGRTVRIFSAASESLLSGSSGQFPSDTTCPPAPLDTDWAPRRLSVDPEGRYAYVLHRAEDADVCTGVTPRLGDRPGIPVTVLDLFGEIGITLADMKGDGSYDGSRLELANWIGNATPAVAVDAGARVIDYASCQDVPLDATNPESWRNAGSEDAGHWKSRFLIVTEAASGIQLGMSCPTFPSGCVRIGEPWPEGCHLGSDPRCTTCRLLPCDGLATPYLLVIYDLNPQLLTGCGRPTGYLTIENKLFGKPRAAIQMEFSTTGPPEEMGFGLASNNDDLFVVAPKTGKLLKTSVSKTLSEGRQSASDPLLITDSTMLASHDFGAGSYPTDAVVMTVPNQVDFVYVPLAGTNQIARLIPATLVLNPSEPKAINSASGNAPDPVFPTAIARRDQGDKVFSANYLDGSVAPIPGDSISMGTKRAAKVGSGTERLAISPQNGSGSLAFHLDVSLAAAPASAFDASAHQNAIRGEVRSLELLVANASASAAAVDAQAANISRDVARWIVDARLARVVSVDLADIGSLYRKEKGGH